MSDKLAKKYSDLPVKEQDKIDAILFNQFNMIVSIGDFLIGNRGEIYTVTNIELYQYKKWRKDDREKFDLIDDVKIICDDTTIKGTEYLSNYTVWKGTYEELVESAMDFTVKGQEKEVKPKHEDSNSLMTFNKEAFVSLKEGLVLKTQAMQAKMRMAEAMLRKKRYELEAILEPLLEEIKRVTVIIWTIELYLGIKENILLVQKGEEADLETPIHLMQEMLFMDEEVGDPSNDGLDFTNMEDFYDWMVKKNDFFGYENYQLLLPYEKSVRIMRIRRERKDYGDPFINIKLNNLNFQTLLLIRNGTTIYSIETDMRFGEKLFPNEDELMKLSQEIIDSNKRVISRNGRKMDDEYLKEIHDKKLQSVTDEYKRNFIIIQGLIDRTEVFGKLFGRVNIMSGSAINKGQVVFVYDAEKSNIIDSNDQTFLEKIREINSNIDEGSRVIHLLPYSYRDTSDFFREYRRYEGNYPRYPEFMTIQHLKRDKEREFLYFMYLPDEEIWSEKHGYSQRKKKVAFKANISKEHCVDVDSFSHRDINYLVSMMYDRRQRRYYMQYMKILKYLVEFKKKELEEEKPFGMLVQQQCQCTEEEALDAIFWWKTKNKYKRALTADDAKALRMIKKHLKIK